MGWMGKMPARYLRYNLMPYHLAILLSLLKGDKGCAVEVNRDSFILRLSWIFGALNAPFAILALIDLLAFELPRSALQMQGFLTAIVVIVGAVGGLTARKHHSIKRKSVHLIIAILPIIWLLVLRYFITSL